MDVNTHTMAAYTAHAVPLWIGLFLTAAVIACLVVVALIVALARSSGTARSILAAFLAAAVAVPSIGVVVLLLYSAGGVPQPRTAEFRDTQAISFDATSVEVPKVSLASNALDTPTEVIRESVVYPENRPEWVTHAQAPSPRSKRFTVSSDPFAIRGDAIAQLETRIAEALRQQAEAKSNDPKVGQIVAAEAEHARELLEIDTSKAYEPTVLADEGVVLDNLYVEKVTFPQPVGEMYQVHANVIINQQFESYVNTQWRAVESQRRFVRIGSTAAAVVIGLLLLSTVLRVGARLASRRGRLQSRAAAAILLLVIAWPVFAA